MARTTHPLVEQREIPVRVAHETRELAAAIDGAQREINLLREYRTRLVADVVTGKLDVRAAAASLPDEASEPPPALDTDEDAVTDLGADLPGDS